MNPLDYTLARMGELKPRLTELGQKDKLTDEEKGEFARVTSEWDELDERRIDLEERQRRAQAAGQIDFQVMKREEDPFKVDIGPSVSRSQVLGHGKRAVDAMGAKFRSDSHAEDVTRLMERGGKLGDVAARMAVLTGSDAYRENYLAYMTGKQNFDAELLERANEEYVRAMTAGTGATGGFMVPLYMDPTWQITGAGAYNPIRDVANVKQITTLTYNGSTGTGGTGEWVAENTAVADKAPAIAQVQIPTWKGIAYIPASFEAFEDIDTLSADLGEWFADAKNTLEATAFATGSGSNQPTGVVTAVTAVTASRVSPATGGTFVVGDVYKMHAALPARYRYSPAGGRAWTGSVNIIDAMRQFGTANNYHGFLTDLTAGQPPRLLGDQLLEASTMATTITTGQNILLFGDFSRYYIIDRVGTQTEFIPNVFDQATGRPSATRAWLMHWRVGANVSDANGFRILLL